MRLRSAIATLLVAAPLAGAPLAAQNATRTAAPDARSGAAQMPARAVLLEDVERSRGNVLKYVDAAPDSVLGYRPMPGVRTFAEQIAHAAGANPMLFGMALKLPSRMAPPDTAAIGRSKPALRAFVVQSYDEFARMVREASDAQLTAVGGFAGNTKTGWRWVTTALEHTTWTLGQTVPYLRANGVTPPQYLPF